MSGSNHLECPFCKDQGDTVYITDDSLIEQHFNDLLPHTLECSTCGAVGKKKVGCCRVRYEWSGKGSYKDVARFECSDCEHHYYARIVERNGGFEIGSKVEPPPIGINVRRQRMLCGDCQGKGGKGDLLNDILRRQKGLQESDPFGLF